MWCCQPSPSAISFNPEPTATADYKSPVSFHVVQRGVLSAVAVGSGLNEGTATVDELNKQKRFETCRFEVTRIRMCLIALPIPAERKGAQIPSEEKTMCAPPRNNSSFIALCLLCAGICYLISVGQARAQTSDDKGSDSAGLKALAPTVPLLEANQRTQRAGRAGAGVYKMRHRTALVPQKCAVLVPERIARRRKRVHPG